jgi:DNA polymerase III delta prime subunit
VKGVLENSLHKAALIDLGMAYEPDAVAYPWEMVVERPDATPQPLPQGTPIASVFDELRGELLILGSPGSGKTTMLLELARTLIERAQQEETHPIPVVFNLSSWAEKQPPLADWLVEELNARYDVPRKVGQSWIDHDQVLPLLDGLDEVRQDARDACVEAINAYRQDHGMVGMVVCSRVADYAALTAKLKLRGAIMVQPLTDEQIDSYLAQTGDQLVSVRTLLHEDAEMRVFANTPLMLSIMSLAYQGMPPEALPEQASLDARRRHLFDTYVERMLNRRGGSKHYTSEQTRHWLSWLAGRMEEHGQTVFYLEKMQPTWLSGGWLRRLYRLASRLVGGLADAIEPVEAVRWSWRQALAASWWRVTGLVAGLGLGGWLAELAGGGWSGGLVGGLVSGLVSGLIFGLSGGMGVGLGIGLTIGLIFALGIGLIFGLIFGLVGSGRGVGLVGGLGMGLLWFIDKGMIADEVGSKNRPNEGIRLSIRNAAIGSLVGGLGFGLLFGLGFGVLFGRGFGLFFGLVFGLLFGLVGGFGVGGGATFVQHSILRIVLALNNHAPLNYVRFLDHAAERILLRKVGGGYIFVHRMLLEYFASLEEEQPRTNDTSDDRPA